MDTKELNKPDLVSPVPPNETNDSSKGSINTDSVNPTVENRTIDSPDGSNNTDNSKNSKISNGKDFAMSHSGEEQSMKNSSDKVVNPQVEVTDNGKNERTNHEKNGETDNRKNDGTENRKKDGIESGKKGTDSDKEGIDSGKDRTDNGKDGTDSEKDRTKENNNEDERVSESGVNETCTGLANYCSDSNGLIACIQSFDAGNSYFFLAFFKLVY